MDEKKGVWRTIRGRRVFIEEGQSLYDAMEKSGKFGKLQGSNRPQVHAKTQTKENKRRYGEIGEEAQRRHKIAEDEITEARRLGSDIREEIAKDTRDYAFGKLKNQKDNIMESQKNINKYMKNNNQRKEYELKMDEHDEEMLESIYTYSNERPKEKNSYYKKIEEKYGKDFAEKKYKELEDKYDIVVGSYTDSEGVSYNSLKEKRTTEQVNREYNELSKKMQADDYYYDFNDDKKLKDLRAEYDTLVAKGQPDVNNWRELVRNNNAEMEKKLQELESKRGKGEYQYNEDKWLDDYYGTFRENEKRNAKIKKESPDEKYEYVEAYAGYKEKFNKHGDYDTWYGSEYTNDEFMEHLTDANWHAERKLIEEAGLTNAQLTKLKNQVKLGQWSADLDMERTRRLINEVKGSNKSKGDKVREIKAQNSYTSKELKEKYGTDDVDIINAGKSSDERVSKKEDALAKSKLIEHYKNGQGVSDDWFTEEAKKIGMPYDEIGEEVYKRKGIALDSTDNKIKEIVARKEKEKFENLLNKFKKMQDDDNVSSEEKKFARGEFERLEKEIKRYADYEKYFKIMSNSRSN